jgi:hypothetical protein
MPARRRDYDQGDIVVEDLPDVEDPESRNQQLPSVEEYKSNVVPKSSKTPKKTILIVFGIATVISLTIIGVVVAKKSKSESNSASALSGRTKLVEEFLFTNQISTLPQLREIGSPHHLATAFVADGDTLHLDFMATQASAKRFVERYVLALLYYHFNGPGWTFNLKFLSGLDHCQWNDEFETSNGKNVRQGVICNEDGYVVELNLGKFLARNLERSQVTTFSKCTNFLPRSLEQPPRNSHP